MHSLKIGLMIAHQGLWNEVQACLRDLPVRVLLQEPALGDLAVFAAQLEHLRLDVLLLDLTQLHAPVEQVIRHIKSVAGAPMVIALSDTAAPETILGAIRAGANEFLYPPLEPALQKALERLAAERAKQAAATRQQAKMLGFVSAKGGCGATTVACHVAVEIQRATGQDVLLADLDMDSGMIGFLMKSKSPYSILDAAKNVHRLDTSYWKALVSNGQGHLEVITSPGVSSIGDSVPPEQFHSVMQFLRSVYRWVVADFGRSLNSLSLSLLEDFDETFVIATMDVPSLHQAKQVVETLLDAGYNRNRLHLVLNRMPKRSDVMPGEVQRALGLPIYEMLPNDYPELFEAYSEGNLLPASSELGKSLSAFALKIAGVPPKDKSRARPSLSIF